MTSKSLSESHCRKETNLQKVLSLAPIAIWLLRKEKATRIQRLLKHRTYADHEIRQRKSFSPSYILAVNINDDGYLNLDNLRDATT